jgi:CBS domain-containing protein
MSLRDLPVSDLMVTDLLIFTADLNVRDALRLLVEWDVGGAPVVDDDNHVIGMLTTGDLILEESRLHFPTIVNFLGVNVALPWHDKELDADVSKALGEFVGDVMTPPPIVTTEPDASIEDVATLMHDSHVSRLPVVEDDELVGVISRGDIIRAMVLGFDDDDEGDDDEDWDESEDDDVRRAGEQLDDLTEMLEDRAEHDDELAEREARSAQLAENGADEA